MFMFSAALGADEVYETYKRHGDVWAKSGSVITEIAGIAVESMIATALIATPAGWVAVAALAIGEAITFSATGVLLEKGGEWVGDKVHEGYDWLKEHLASWL
jgi:hypothetical protein